MKEQFTDNMKEEFIEIALKLRKWAKKYNKKYATICVIKNDAFGNINQNDIDYKRLEFFISEEGIFDVFDISERKENKNE